MANLNDPRELYYVQEGNSSYTPSNVAAQRRFTRGILTLVPIGKGAQLSWRAGQGLARFAKGGGFYHTRRGGGKAVSTYRRASARIRRPIRGSGTYQRISRRLPFYKSRSRVRAATDLAADSAVLYYGGRKVYRKTRALGARSKTSPTRTAYSQRDVPWKSASPKSKASWKPGGKRRHHRQRCKPGYYYNHKARRCMKSKFP